MTDERLNEIEKRRPYMTCHDQKDCIDEIKRLRSELATAKNLANLADQWMQEKTAVEECERLRAELARYTDGKARLSVSLEMYEKVEKERTRLAYELSRYKTPCVDEIEVKG